MLCKLHIPCLYKYYSLCEINLRAVLGSEADLGLPPVIYIKHTPTYLADSRKQRLTGTS